MLEELKESVYQANLELPKQGLVKYTWGNVSGVDRREQLFVIKPSGVAYEDLSAKDMVVCDFDGHVVEGKLSPSSDTPTHAILYRMFDEIGGICHTHSTWATSWAQAGLDIPAMGTTHADTFYGSIPCTRYLSQEEIDHGYELETGQLIVTTFKERQIDPIATPAVLLHGHGPFVWGADPLKAVMNSVVLEEISHTNFIARQLNSFSETLPQRLLDKHYYRKHGADAYYGQKN